MLLDPTISLVTYALVSGDWGDSMHKDIVGGVRASRWGGSRVAGKRRLRPWFASISGAIAIMPGTAATAADVLPSEAVTASYTEPAAFDWTGFYLGGHMGYAWGKSNWSAAQPGQPSISGSFGL